MDRNYDVDEEGNNLGGSLSARRAWIEMPVMAAASTQPYVALRKESVDRNFSLAVLRRAKKMSLSARRAWIEMQIAGSSGFLSACRSPQGERG